MRPLSTRRGFTLVELLVVIAIIGMLIALLLPAVQAARESARRTQCVNNLKQVGLAVMNYENAQKHLPSSGNNGQITKVGGATGVIATAKNSPEFQNAGVLFQILPYLEQQNVFDSDDATIQRTAVTAYFCPSRRPAITRPNNAGNPIGLNDYAVPMWKDTTAGGGLGGNSAGCWNYWSDSVNPSDTTNYPFYRNTVFVRGGKGTGANATQFPPGQLSDILDGTSNTLMLAEKFVDPSRYRPVQLNQDPVQHTWGSLGFTDNGYYQGWSWSTLRCSQGGPIMDKAYTTNAFWQMLGSAHPAGMNGLASDGSVHGFRYSMANGVLQLLVRKNDGLSVSLTGL